MMSFLFDGSGEVLINIYLFVESFWRIVHNSHTRNIQHRKTMLPDTILNECSEFLLRSECRPLYRPLQISGDGFRRVKIRKKASYAHRYDEYFDLAFKHKREDLRLRSLIAQTQTTPVMDAALERFYVFPINGYKILYSQQIKDYSEYLKLLESVLSDTDMADSILKKLFQNAYQEDSIIDAMDTGSNILVYNIPYYYAIRESLIVDYKAFVAS